MCLGATGMEEKNDCGCLSSNCALSPRLVLGSFWNRKDDLRTSCLAWGGGEVSLRNQDSLALPCSCLRLPALLLISRVPSLLWLVASFLLPGGTLRPSWWTPGSLDPEQEVLKRAAT